MARFLSVTLGGLSGGMIYAAVALSLVLIWRATRVLNFAQGAMAMFTAYLAYKVIEHGASYWVALVVALAAGLVMGAVVERLLVRPVENGPPLNAVVVTLGVFIVVEGLAGMFFGGTPHRYPTHFSNVNYTFGDVSALAPFDIWVIVSVALVVVWAVVQDFELSWLGWVSRIVPLLLLAINIFPLIWTIHLSFTNYRANRPNAPISRCRCSRIASRTSRPTMSVVRSGPTGWR